MNYNKFILYKNYVINQANVTYYNKIQNNINTTIGQEIYYIIKNDFPTIIKKIKFTNNDPFNDDNNINNLWEYRKNIYN
jgi:hypothetical protein